MNEKEQAECRKVFEEWASGQNHNLETDAYGWYVDELTSYAFDAWESAWKHRAVLEGWRLVPVNPTYRMLDEAAKAWRNDPRRKSSTLYRAMLNAAPEYGEWKYEE